ncbi:carboxymuconolactone decarboxylase family protein [Pseudomonas sp. TNT2022 ID1044]|uniref:carboxymuconolactone decarboxylase family protein n=1 Tax=Pseudomonas sp. TNT2022 ID1044 TaxID=2942636 RepID=UPI002362D675|nr:carboxymuconolactone decarboxylase family protein [Pseudomonas sp. TNT2022 ID1044]MDD0997987.1 carboxymuconolactone decarboxylase family protein [Pseudomonas sp. TNT2022 ID1044]
MSRINVPDVATATDATAVVYNEVRKIAGGTVPNLYAVIGHLNPALLTAVLDAEATLASGSLSKQDLETIKILVSARTGCDYCEAAHVMLGKMTGLTTDTIKKIRLGQSTGDAKRDALIHFVLTLHETEGTLGEHDYAGILAAGYTDVQLLEISLVFALTIFTNAFNRINDTEIDFPKVD